MIDNERCDKRFIWNPSNCECECAKLGNIGEYLDYKKYRYRKKIIVWLAEECSENVMEIKWFLMVNDFTF